MDVALLGAAWCIDGPAKNADIWCATAGVTAKLAVQESIVFI